MKKNNTATYRVQNIISFFSFVMLVLANSSVLYDSIYARIIEYAGCGSLVIASIYYLWKDRSLGKKDKIKRCIIFSIVFILFSIGIILQPMQVATKARLILTMFTIEVFILSSGSFASSQKIERSSSYGILVGILLSIVLGIIFKTDLLKEVNDQNALIPFGFNGGIKYKNFFAAFLVCSCIGFFYDVRDSKNPTSLALTVITGLAVLASGSRGGLLLLITFFFLQVIVAFKNRLKKGAQIIKLIIIAFFIPIICIGGYYLSSSATYEFRVNGVKNYIEFIADKPFRIAFGSADIAYKNNGDYVQNIRSYLEQKGYRGQTGTYEMGFINTLIKNGILGIVGFIICYAVIIKDSKKTKEENGEQAQILLIVLLLSATVESYVCNIHTVLGIYIYITINGLIRRGKEGYPVCN